MNLLRLRARWILLAAVAVGTLGCSTLPVTPTISRRLVEPAPILAPMPEAVTSFAAVTHDGWLYVCGGHKGERHDYNATQVSGAFHRLDLASGTTWETLPATAPGQGMPLVAHGNHIIRTGGMAARNNPGEKQDLISSAAVQRFNTQTLRWDTLPSLPEVRSSHDAVVVGDTLVVGGGWSLSGGTNAPAWPDHGVTLDLRNPEKGWKKFPQPFRRRALALAAVDSKVHFIGGMDSDNKPTLAVDIYDLTTGTWSKGPNLPEGRFKGFACSGIAQAGSIYANMFQGDLLRLTPGSTAWEKVGRVTHPRMAHRLVTAGDRQLIVLGGEDGEDKRPDLELLSPASLSVSTFRPSTP
jgi:N-acetylneuraminic acid mutarotase